MSRVTDKDLSCIVEHINRITKSPAEYSTTDAVGKRTINVGHYHLNHAYGGVQLLRTINSAGGCSAISTDGHGTKRQLYSWLRAFMAGLDAK
jgi:hypothetical protein